MSITNLLVVVAAVLCTLFAQGKHFSVLTQRGCALLGGLACIVVAVEALQRTDTSSALLFAGAAAMDLLIAAKHYLAPESDA